MRTIGTIIEKCCTIWFSLEEELKMIMESMVCEWRYFQKIKCGVKIRPRYLIFQQCLFRPSTRNALEIPLYLCTLGVLMLINMEMAGCDIGSAHQLSGSGFEETILGYATQTPTRACDLIFN